MSECLFCKIIAGQIPGKFVYRDSAFVAFCDIHPKAPVHLLICPIAHSDTFQNTESDIIAGLGGAIQQIACELGLQENYTLQINNGFASGQVVFHLHAHFMSFSNAAAERVADILESA